MGQILISTIIDGPVQNKLSKIRSGTFPCDPFFSVTDYHATPFDWEQARVNEAPFGSGDDYLSHMLNHGSAAGMAEDLCPTRASVLGLAVTCALLVVLYVCTVFCVCIRRTAMARSVRNP